VKQTLSALLLAVLMAPLPAQAVPYPMAGVWFGTGQPNDRSEMYIDYFNADGGFHNQHRECRQGRIASEIRETGRWSVKGNILSIDIATVNGNSEPRTDQYRLISVDATTQKYVVLPTNFPYNAHRMAAGFSMPPCDLTS
jgi:hypothetical protein